MSETNLDRSPQALTARFTPTENSEFSAELSIPASGISFYIIRLAKAVLVHAKTEFSIGRNVNGDPLDAMLDLEAFDGFKMGVSRQHAMIHPVKNGYEIVDLFSRNGTWLDGQRLFPIKAYPLACGQKLRIGHEQMLVLYRSVQESDREKS